jgi:class 3 adenylate cyclase
MELGGWLRNLGLEQYESAFRENAIDTTILARLTAADLKELGVDAVGHRRRLLDAIAELRTDRIDWPGGGTAERRRITVVFADLVGSTALSARMDPEDLRELLSGYRRCVVDTVRRFDGVVATYSGDGVLIYFGHPAAHEDDAERAVAAGLALIAAATALEWRASLKVRVGIATGLVVVGDRIGAGEMWQRDVVGETPNLASRLQAIAQPNTVVIAESTRRLLGDLFELEAIGAVELKGVTGKVPAWVALRLSSVESRFEALRAHALTALVGREEECELLWRHWQQTKAGEGQAVLVSGESGIGKSRLVAALGKRAASEPHTVHIQAFGPQYQTRGSEHDRTADPRSAEATRDSAVEENEDGQNRSILIHLLDLATPATGSAAFPTTADLRKDQLDRRAGRLRQGHDGDDKGQGWHQRAPIATLLERDETVAPDRISVRWAIVRESQPRVRQEHAAGSPQVTAANDKAL